MKFYLELQLQMSKQYQFVSQNIFIRNFFTKLLLYLYLTQNLILVSLICWNIFWLMSALIYITYLMLMIRILSSQMNWITKTKLNFLSKFLNAYLMFQSRNILLLSNKDIKKLKQDKCWITASYSTKLIKLLVEMTLLIGIY